MRGTTHLTSGVCAGAILCSYLKQPLSTETIFIASGAIIGSLFPDIDEPQSLLGRKIKPISWLTKKATGHRGIIHTPFMLVLFGILLYFLYWKFPLNANIQLFGLGFVIGYMMHLILDALTPRGIMLFSPFSDKRYSIIKWKWRSKDLICSIIMILGTIAFFCYKYNLLSFLKNFKM